MIRANDIHDLQESAYLGGPRVSVHAHVGDRSFAREMAEVQAGYFAGGTSRYLPRPPGVNSLGTGGDYHYRTEQEYFLMVERARADDRDNMVIGQGINRLVANVMSAGFSLQADTGDEELNSDLEASWSEWSTERTACDYEGERTFAELAALLFRCTIVDGDVFVLPTVDGQLQVVENHHVRNPSAKNAKVRNGTGIVHGVEIRGGRKVAYHLTPEDLEPSGAVRNPDRMRRIPAYDADGYRQVFHLYQAKRFSQRRGVTSLAPIVFPTKYHDDLQFAALVNAKRAGFIAYLREYDPTVATTRRGAQTGSRSEVTRADGTTQYLETGGPGQVIPAQPGEKYTPWSPNIPSPQFFPHASLLLAIMAINLDLPELVFMLDASRANFSAWRGAMDQARERFSQMRRQMLRQLHCETYAWHIRRRMTAEPALRRASDRSDVSILRHEFTPPAWPYIQPVQDAAADDLRLSRNLTSPRRWAAERGYQWQQLQSEIVADRTMFYRACLEQAQQLNDEFQDAGVTWRDIAFGNGGGVRVNLSGMVDDQSTAMETTSAPDSTE